MRCLSSCSTYDGMRRLSAPLRCHLEDSRALYYTLLAYRVFLTRLRPIRTETRFCPLKERGEYCDLTSQVKRRQRALQGAHQDPGAEDQRALHE